MEMMIIQKTFKKHRLRGGKGCQLYINIKKYKNKMLKLLENS